MALRHARRHALLLALAVAIASFALGEGSAAALSTDVAGLTAPVAAGESAANIPLNGAQKRVLVRWVARASGTLTGLHLRIQADGSACRQSGRTGYGLGDGGSWRVTTHPVLPDGRPDVSITLATQEFRPCSAPLSVVDVSQGIVRVPMQLSVERGSEYATVVTNSDPDAAHNYTSMNFLYTSSGILGANGRNERSPLAPDAYYGLDPRELVGYSVDGGSSWSLPGGPYGKAGGRSFLPTYLQQYADGEITGQPYYYASGASTSPRTMAFGNVKHSWTISALGAYTPRQGTGTLTLTVDGSVRATAPVAGIGMLRGAIAPVTVSPGQIVRVTASGLAIQDIVADTAWGRLVGLHLASKPWYVEGEKNFSHAAPVYALPAYDSVGGVSYPPLSGLHSSAHTITGSGHRRHAHRRRVRHGHHKQLRRHKRHRASGFG
jgi:hypothetical protein